jgi:putative membrane protein
MMNFGFGGIGMVLFWIVIAAGVYLAISGLVKLRDKDNSQRQAPSEILKRRYASGEITDEEYKRRLRELEKV